jgi:putative endonuclease
MEHQYFVYIMTNKNNTVLYTGVTNNLERRCCEHREKRIEGFSKKYNVVKLVYFETTQDIEAALNREKQIKAGSRAKKIQLINELNRLWEDLSAGF